MNELKCSLEMVQQWQDGITTTKNKFGPGSDEHCKAVAWAEAQGPALVADYLSLAAQLHQEREARERLETALSWYADAASWKRRPGRWDHLPTGLAILLDQESSIELDRGHRARAALVSSKK